MRSIKLLVLVLTALSVVGCGRYSYRIRSSYARGHYAAAVAQCQGDAAASTRWNPGHRARYHVYCGMTYLTIGDTNRAASELVQAERIRIAQPGLVAGRDLDQLNHGLMQLFGVPSGQLLIEERAAVGGVAPAPAVQESAKAAAPAGSYQESCDAVTVEGTTLVASCRRRDGQWV